MTDYRTGDLVLVCAQGWERRLVQFTHVELAYWWPWDQVAQVGDPQIDLGVWLTIGAGFSGVRSWWPVAHFGRPYAVVRPLVDPDKAREAVNLAVIWQGNPYGWDNLGKAAWRYLRKALARWAGGRLVAVGVGDRTPLDCSAFVVSMYRKRGFDLVPGVADVKTIMPDDIWNAGQWQLVGWYDQDGNLEVIE